MVTDWHITLLNCFSCFYMTGIIWLIQSVHYPSFFVISRESFPVFHLSHTNRMGGLVGPVMIMELVTTLWLARSLSPIWIANLGLVLGVWLTTFFASVPLHQKLSENQDPEIIRKLIRTNWIRTFLWSCRSLILLVILSSNPPS